MNQTSKLIILLLIPAVILGAAYLYKKQVYSSKRTGMDVKAAEVKKIDPQEFDELAEDEGVFIVDVHTPEQTHIKGTDAFIPYNEIKDSSDQLPEDRDTPIIVYCRSGSMSDQASKNLADMGYTNVYDLIGGINAYREQHVSVYITPDEQDLGTVVYGDVATADFTLHNSTPKDLEVTRVSTSCECTSADLEPQTLEPYQEVQFTVSFDPAVHEDDTDLGDIVRTVYIETDNQNFDRVTTEIIGTVIKEQQ